MSSNVRRFNFAVVGHARVRERLPWSTEDNAATMTRIGMKSVNASYTLPLHKIDGFKHGAAAEFYINGENLLTKMIYKYDDNRYQPLGVDYLINRMVSVGMRVRL